MVQKVEDGCPEQVQRRPPAKRKVAPIDVDQILSYLVYPAAEGLPYDRSSNMTI